MNIECQSIETYSIIATYYYYYHLFTLLEYAKGILNDGDSLNIMQISSNHDNKIISFEANDWYEYGELDYIMFLGTGGSSAGIKAQITRNGDLYTVVYRYCLYDTYDWTIPASFLPGFPADDIIHNMLHETGLAREYNVYGEITETFTFS